MVQRWTLGDVDLESMARAKEHLLRYWTVEQQAPAQLLDELQRRSHHVPCCSYALTVKPQLEYWRKTSFVCASAEEGRQIC